MTLAHEEWMARALKLAELGEGLTRPNPPVGAVIVREGQIVGEGWHRRAGGPHAEIYALRSAGDRARGATLYVTLEPCSTWGRTPPCTEAIIRSGLRTVVAATVDPNPRHAGRGLDQLRAAGLEVIVGVLEPAARRLIEPFEKWVLEGRPFVTLKMAMTLDGRIADASGASRWITGIAARNKVHEMRRRADGILVGHGTVLRDNPTLLPRPARGRRPWRIVLATDGRLPRQATVLTDGRQAQTLVVVSERCPARRIRALERTGATVWKLPTRDGRIRLDRLFAQLGELGLLHVLCEGGGTLAGSLLAEGLVDEYVFFVAPRVFGDKGKPVVSGVSWRLDNAPELPWRTAERVGADWMICGRLRKTGGGTR